MRLLDLLPDEVKRSEYVQDIETMLEIIVAEGEKKLTETLEGMFVTTVDSKGMEKFEEDYGIKVAPNSHLDDRRSVILAKMRGQGTCTEQMVKNMAMAFSGGEVELEQHPEDFSVDIKFVGTLGIPPNMEDFRRAVEEVLPAHITYLLVYTYATWQMARSFTWGSLNDYTWEQFRNGDMMK